MASALSIKEAKEKLGRFCAFRERSPNEVLEKLKSWGLSEDQGNDIVAEMIKLNFVNEQRFANAYCHDKFEFNSWGKQKIRSSIFTHKISEAVIQKALDRIDIGKYKSRLYELAKRKWDKLENEVEVKRKQKTVNHLASKGFEANLIWNTIEMLQSEKGQA